MIIDSKYNKFIGMKVLVNRTESECKGRTYSEYDIDKADTTINQIESEAASDKFRLRVWLPMTSGTCDYRLDRINVVVDKVEDGTYEVTEINLG